MTKLWQQSGMKPDSCVNYSIANLNTEAEIKGQLNYIQLIMDHAILNMQKEVLFVRFWVWFFHEHKK